MKVKDKIVAAATILLLLTTIKQQPKTIKRSKWVDDWLLKYGTESLDGIWYEKVFDEWAKTNPERFKRTLRLPPAIFNQLLDMVESFIKKQNTVMRKAVPAEKRLAITLKFLATGVLFLAFFHLEKLFQNFYLGESSYSLSGQFCVGASTVADIVKDTCKAIIYVPRDTMTVPNQSDEWKV